MFTGIVEELGRIDRIAVTRDAARLTVHGPLAVTGAREGDSISVNGVCLTVVSSTDEAFTTDVMAQTLKMSTLGSLGAGSPVNLERAALVGGRLGGHIVQGHVDGTARLLEVTEGSAWRVLRFSLPSELAALVVAKGSIAVDGVSLTVSEISAPDASEAWFEVSLIPETLRVTTLGLKAIGDTANVETDILARHVERLLAVRSAS